MNEALKPSIILYGQRDVVVIFNDRGGVMRRADHDDYSDNGAYLEYMTLSVASYAALTINSTVRFVAYINIFKHSSELLFFF